MRVAIGLGLGGLLPFFFGVALLAFPALASLVAAQTGLAVDGAAVLMSYGAVILSFMGAVHWGAALEREPDTAWPFVISVLPALWGWFLWSAFVLQVENRPMLLGGMALGFAALLVFDLLRARNGDFPKWYPPLRIGLTTGVCASLIAGAILIA